MQILVEDLMTRTPWCCRPDTNLATVAELMWTHDCGALPVVEDGHVLGMITDRDVAIALGTRGLRASEVTVSEVATHPVVYCRENDDVHAALHLMTDARVRRLPVVNDHDELTGMIALNDLVLAARPTNGHKSELENEEVLHTLRRICAHSDVQVMVATA
ncbi:MAG TPA: CBS domain-containing protein [Bryobacteraceae bacterium]|nr:CBS domain-containing protein [Bryobacteraceae bacterium]